MTLEGTLGWPKKNLGWPSGKVWVAQWKTLGGPRVEIKEVSLFATKVRKKAGTRGESGLKEQAEGR